MAISDDQLAELRRMIDEADNTTGWTDLVLSALFDSNGTDLRLTAKSIWEAKAASYVELVNTSESGSSRSMSQKFDHAITMAKTFGADSSGTDTVINAPRSTKIVRATREG
jgi:hypothetical protein